VGESLNLPAEIDRITFQLAEARDIETVREIHDRAEALRVYCRKHDGLMEAGNRLAGITALCERRIGQELRSTTLSKGGRPSKTSSAEEEVSAPTIPELGLTHKQSAAYQELAHEDVAENVILDAIAEAGKEGRFITKADIHRAVRGEIERKRAARGEAPKKPVDPDLQAAADDWNETRLIREFWSPVMEVLEKLAALPKPAELFANYYEPFDFALRRVLPKADDWMITFLEEWDARERLSRERQRHSA